MLVLAVVVMLDAVADAAQSSLTVGVGPPFPRGGGDGAASSPAQNSRNPKC